MTQNENLQRSENNEVILINAAEETQSDSSMALTPTSLLLKMPLIVHELACVTCDEITTGIFICRSNCRNAIHYLCTSLLAYQIYNFINSNCTLTCINCTKGEYSYIVHLATDSKLIKFL